MSTSSAPQWKKVKLITVTRDSGRLLCFGRDIFLSFRPPIFRRPWVDFRETLPHKAAYPEIVYLL